MICDETEQHNGETGTGRIAAAAGHRPHAPSFGKTRQLSAGVGDVRVIFSGVFQGNVLGFFLEKNVVLLGLRFN